MHISVSSSMSFKMMEGDFLGNQEEGGYVSTLMHKELSLQDHVATYILMQCIHTHAHTFRHTLTHTTLQRYTLIV